MRKIVVSEFWTLDGVIERPVGLEGVIILTYYPKENTGEKV